MVLLWPSLLCCREPVGATVARPAPARLSFSGGVAGGAAPGCVTPVSLSAPEVTPTAQMSPALPPCPAGNPPPSPARPCCRFCSQVWHSLLHLHLCDLLFLRPSRILLSPRPLHTLASAASLRFGCAQRRPAPAATASALSAATRGLAPLGARRAPPHAARRVQLHALAGTYRMHASSMSFASFSFRRRERW